MSTGESVLVPGACAMELQPPSAVTRHCPACFVLEVTAVMGEIPGVAQGLPFGPLTWLFPELLVPNHPAPQGRCVTLWALMAGGPETRAWHPARHMPGQRSH